MSLSDRFTQYQKMRPQSSDESAKTTSAQQASAVNRRHQQFLANRPSVQESVGNLNKMSVKKRLGPSNVNIRLNLNATRRDSSHRDVLGRGSGQRGGFDRVDWLRRGRGRQNGCIGRPGAGVARGGKLEVTRGDLRGNREPGREKVARGGRSALGENRRGRGANRLRDGGPDSFQRGGRGWGRGLRRGRRDNLRMIKEQLDNQLEEYMSDKMANQDQEMVTYMDQNES